LVPQWWKLQSTTARQFAIGVTTLTILMLVPLMATTGQIGL